MAAAVAAAGLATAAAVIGTGAAVAAPQTAPAAARSFYLSLGGDDSVGAQPNASGKNVKTSAGYANQLFAALHRFNRGLHLVNLGCLGESTSTMIHGGLCRYRDGSQLAQAAAFLKKHQGHVQLVTLEVGATDLDPCLALTDLKQIAPCFARVILRAVQNLTTITTVLTKASPVPVKIVGTAYGNPGVAVWLQGTPAARTIARDGVALAQGYAADLTKVYSKFGVPVANIFDAFRNGDFTDMVMLPPFGSVPENVALACTYTWVCSPPPTAGNELPNRLGYAVMANAFLDADLGIPAS
jgi:lysophospholipase L1-like esterase